jgi:hypothetical protein
MKIDKVGIFQDKGGYWECSPELMKGALLSIETPAISNEQASIAQVICGSWTSKIGSALQYIEKARTEYKLEAKYFTNPNAFINSNEEWAIYFDTESETEAVVGVEFRNETPYQLVIGD